jgi:hypothetical protein
MILRLARNLNRFVLDGVPFLCFWVVGFTCFCLAALFETVSDYCGAQCEKIREEEP